MYVTCFPLKPIIYACKVFEIKHNVNDYYKFNGTAINDFSLQHLQKIYKKIELIQYYVSIGSEYNDQQILFVHGNVLSYQENIVNKMGKGIEAS